ncbi:phasin family protein [Natronocella acetinitrilica]|uniref:Phasin family protein n=1 Tax=Natronocella acetinitrilica TaxID=414046 RepID=A0AAE3G465_9GAMM|nr:phasin family protein [Natronocella acetinitrilica]MCP1675077.1 phasin family protein [Natronocella acetinitrilica]
MYDAMFKNFGADFQTAFVPMQKFNALVIDQLAKVAEFQLAAAKTYSEMGVEQLRAVAGIQDAKSLQAFVESQNKVAKTLSEKLNQDVNTLAGLGKDFTAELQKLAQENVSAANKAAKAA